jgi:hypothetical protein
MKYVTPDVWGEYFWKTIHVVALGYPARGATPDQKGAYRAFFESLKTAIPCSVCAKGYAAILGKRDLEAALDGGRDALFRWTVDVHNDVGAKLRKPPMEESYVKNVYIFEKCEGMGGPPPSPAPSSGPGQSVAPGAALQLGALALVFAFAALAGSARRRGGVPGG